MKDDPLKAGKETTSEGGRASGEKKVTPRPGGPQALIGSVLSGRYRIDRLLGEGGMGAVYEAEHTHMRKRLAVKVLHPEMSRLPEVVARFEREAMAAAHIDHPNVAAATDFGMLEDGSFFLVLEYVEGHSLREVDRRGARSSSGARSTSRTRSRSALMRAHGARHRAPRSQARERDARHEGRRPRLREGARLRHREGPRRQHRERGASGVGGERRAEDPHAARDGLRHARVHGARAGARPVGRRARRPLLARRDPLRDARRHAARSTTRARSRSSGCT